LLYVYHALSAPVARLVLLDPECGIGGTLNLDRRLVPGTVNGFPDDGSTEFPSRDLDFKFAEEHATRGHLENQCVQPVDEQHFVVGCLAADRNGLEGPNSIRVRNDGRKSLSQALEKLLARWRDGAYTHIRLVLEMFPASMLHINSNPGPPPLTCKYWLPLKQINVERLFPRKRGNFLIPERDLRNVQRTTLSGIEPSETRRDGSRIFGPLKVTDFVYRRHLINCFPRPADSLEIKETSFCSSVARSGRRWLTCGRRSTVEQ
jgi:hypothetical protein